MAFLQVNFVERAVLHPNLEHSFDVHLHHVLFLQAVFGFKELGEDGIVKSLRTEQSDVEQKGLADLARFAIPHHRR